MLNIDELRDKIRQKYCGNKKKKLCVGKMVNSVKTVSLMRRVNIKKVVNKFLANLNRWFQLIFQV